MIRTTRIVAALAFAASVGPAAAALAPTPAAGQDAELPPAAEVIDRYVEAIGGRETLLSRPSSHATGTFSLPMAGLEAPIEVFSASDPTRMLTVVTIPGMGEIMEGYTGEHGWSMDPNMGPRLLDGLELASMAENSSTEGSLRDASMFSERTTVERAEMNGEACYKVRLVWNSGREIFDCYSVETGLRVATESVQETPMGDVPVVSLLSGYEAVDGVLMATKVTQQMMGQEQIITLDSVEFTDLDAERFTPPAAIQTLIDQRDSGQ
jgi:hypothetical protein